MGNAWLEGWVDARPFGRLFSVKDL
ncbi:protein of unknown function [Pseudomonas sp. JV551A1]|nr:protein of unknown function [Pseudomonas sp. JV551A1]